MTREEVQQWLTDPDFPEPTRKVELVETHISWVLLTDTRAYKIKKPVRFSFADFSALSQRHFFCDRELMLNRRLTQDMYLSVLPVLRTGNRFSIGKADGEIVDYALCMVRLDNTRQMNLLLEKNEVTPTHMEQLAGRLAEFHQNAQRVGLPFDPEEKIRLFDDLRSMAGFVEMHLGKLARTNLEEALASAPFLIRRIFPRIKERIQLGFRIDGHGDLHSKNIFLLKEPVIFDCIEFNDSFRQIDLLDEIAFFCMDLEHYSKPDLASCFLDLYLRKMPCMPTEEDALIFLFFKWYRCNVRLKVNALRALQAKEPTLFQHWLQAVREYLDQFYGYFLELKARQSF
jgi:aminoglycoside phosphotransferase family enzyme